MTEKLLTGTLSLNTNKQTSLNLAKLYLSLLNYNMPFLPPIEFDFSFNHPRTELDFVYHQQLM